MICLRRCPKTTTPLASPRSLRCAAVPLRPAAVYLRNGLRSSNAGLRAFASTTSSNNTNAVNADPRSRLLPRLDTFPRRHIGPDGSETESMLKQLDPPAASLDEFVKSVIPANVLSSRKLKITSGRWTAKDGLETVHDKGVGLSESELQDSIAGFTERISKVSNLIGYGYAETRTPPVIQRNVLESPAWYTSYTPYQPEISQGRLESLLNFQTMTSDLTGLPVSNASVLDEPTAAAEAMTLSMNALSSAKLKRGSKVFMVSDACHPQTINVLRSRAEGFGIEVRLFDYEKTSKKDVSAVGDDLVGVMVQYPDTRGRIFDFSGLAETVKGMGSTLSVATDLLACTLLKPPGEFGADIAFGNAQRFGVPLGFGGPHAAFFSCSERLKRKIPGRIIGVSKDRLGDKAMRLALQTREQHIRREKATSNICTAQALLANMSAFYAIYHGPHGLKEIAERVVKATRLAKQGLQSLGFDVEEGSESSAPFDTIVVKNLKKQSLTSEKVLDTLSDAKFNLRQHGDDAVGLTFGELSDNEHVEVLLQHFAGLSGGRTSQSATSVPDTKFEDKFNRTSEYLTHQVFNSHHSETELLRYINHLQSKDLSLVHSMIPLGSCTMKLNATSEMVPVSAPAFSNVHPFAPVHQTEAYKVLVKDLEKDLADITGLEGVTVQPNSGAQGEFAGLRVIRKYQQRNGQGHRNVCLIPASAHGTNPASAAMCGMQVVSIKCDAKTGNLDIEDLSQKCAKHKDKLSSIMVTYPSTFGVFEPEIRKVCEIVHEHGGLVYMDGANMNAQIGLCSPGEIGADVCHLNLHKTFCIPHGGGGPGVGPIAVTKALKPYLPAHPLYYKESEEPVAPISGAPYGSASILPISWAYIKMMGSQGLKQATEIGLLNANYLLARLKPHFNILYTNEHGRCAHEFIIDIRPFKELAGIEAIDVAKRLQDYGFHAPTMSWPVSNTLMIEPTESESLAELDRFADALISIRAEIAEVEKGKMPRTGNVLKMAPHTAKDLTTEEWDRPYTRQKAAYPLPWLKEKKFWPTVTRVDDVYGDTNLFCTCPPVEDYDDSN